MLDCWNKIDKKQDLPEDFFQSLPKEVEENLYENKDPKLAGFFQKVTTWPYKRYRVDILGKDGVETLFSEIIEYLLTSEKDSLLIKASL